MKKQQRITPRKKLTTNNNSKSEIKVLDNVSIALPVTVAYIVQALNYVGQGTSYNERIGLRCKSKSLEFKAVVRCGSAILGGTIANFRLLIVEDLQQVSLTQPAGLDVMSILNPIGAYNWFNTARFRIHHDSTILVDVYNPQVKIERLIPLNSLVKFSGTGSTTINKNGLYLILVSDNSINAPSIDYWSRYLFEDS